MLGLVGDDRRGGGTQVALRELGQRVDVRGDCRVLEVDRELQDVVLRAQLREVVRGLGPVGRAAGVRDRLGQAVGVLLLLLEEGFADLQYITLQQRRARLVRGDRHELEVKRRVEDLDIRLIGFVLTGLDARRFRVVAAGPEEHRRTAGEAHA